MANQQRTILTLFLIAITVLLGAFLWVLFDTPVDEGIDSIGERRPRSAWNDDGIQGGGRGASSDADGTDPDARRSPDDKRIPVVPIMGGSRVLQGSAAMSDGTPLPGTLTVAVSTKMPPFSFLTLLDLGRMKNQVITDSGELVEVGQGIEAKTDSSGRFVLSGLGTEEVYLVPVDPLLYAVRSEKINPEEMDDTDRVRLIVELGAVIDGIVTDRGGKPVADVSLTIREKFNPMVALSDRRGMVSSFTTRSGADGSFRFQGIPCNNSMVIDTFSGHHARTIAKTLNLVKGQVLSLELVLELVLEEGSSVSGVVNDKDSRPLARKQVLIAKTDRILDSVGNEHDDGEIKVRSGEDGTFQCENLAAGTYKITLAEPGYVRASHKGIQLAAGQDRSGFILVMDEGLAIGGRVVDSSQQPVKNALVRTVPEFNLSKIMDMVESEKHRNVVHTDENGLFRSAGLVAGTYNLEITRAGITDKSHKGFSAGSEDLLIVLESGGIAGIVVSIDDGEPVRKYRLGLQPTGSTDLLDPFGLKSTINRTIEDEQGKFEIACLSPGTYSMTVRAENLESRIMKNIVVKDGDVTRGILVMLAPEASVSGLVLDQQTGEPIEGARISMKGGLEGMMEEFKGNEVVFTDDEGAYCFGRLSAGPARLIVSHGRYESQNLPEIVLSEGEEIENFDVFLSRGGTIFGRVLGPGNLPLPGATIMASTPMASVMKSTRTDEEGNYEMTGFPPGTYTVIHMASSFSFGEDFLESVTGGMSMQYVSLKKDEVSECNFSVEAATESGVVEGRVTESGRPVSQAIITALPLSGETTGGTTTTTTTSKDGRYKLKKIKPGEYTFRVVRTESLTVGGGTEVVFKTTIPDVPVHEFDMDLPGGSIDGKVIDEDTLKPIQAARILVRRSAAERGDDPVSDAMGGRVGEVYTDKDGAFRISNLKQGTYDLVAGGTNILGMNVGGYARQTIDGIEVHKNRAVHGVRIELEKGGTLDGIVTERDGAAIAGASIFFQPVGADSFESFSECYSDPAGHFSYAGLAKGRYTLAIKHADYATTLVYDISIRKEKTKSISIELSAGTALYIRFKSAAAEEILASATVDLVDKAGNRLSGLIGLTEVMQSFYANDDVPSDSRYLGRYASGSYYVQVVHPDLGTRSLEILIDGTEPQQTFTIEF